MQEPPLAWDIPQPFADLAVTASRYAATLAIYDAEDRLIFANGVARKLYSFFDFSIPHTFESMLRKSWEYGESIGVAAPADPEGQVAYTNIRRRGERLEFIRRHPANLLCSHLRLPNGLNAQLRIQPEKAGLEHLFCSHSPTLGLMEAIRQREEAAQKAAALDCLAFGVAVVSPDRKIRHRNEAMTNLLMRRDGVQMDELGRVTGTFSQESAALGRLIALACLGKLPKSTMTIGLRGAVPGQVHTASISAGAVGSSTAVLVIAPARMDIAAVSGVLRQDYGLTQAEAELAARIGNGMTNDDVAKELDKSQATGRLHVKSILKKLDRGELANRGQTGLARWVAVLGAITGAARSRGVQ